MHTIKLEVEDSIYSHIMFLLKNINSKELKIVEEIENSTNHIIADELDTKIFSNHSANLIEEWKDIQEDEIWK